jgi:tight adherence protein B
MAISLPFLLITGAIPHVIARRREEKWRERIQGLWPEIIDHLISGLQSGLSIAEILVDLGRRGPWETRKVFLECERYLSIGWDLPQIFRFLKGTFADPMADQICEVLDFSRSTGARDTSLTLRTLADYIRNDIAIRSEIKSKHGWVKNSAALAAVAPWLLLLLLASQPNTVNAYASGSGITILIVGAIATIIAYMWMERVSRLQEPPRVFT